MVDDREIGRLNIRNIDPAVLLRFRLRAVELGLSHAALLERLMEADRG